MTENATTAVDEQGAELVVIPVTGEVIDLRATPADRLVEALDRLDVYRDELVAVKGTVEAELVRRLDLTNARREMIGDELELETNAPTTESYDRRVLEAALERLVEEEVIDRVVLERVIVTPPPKPQDPKIDKRELNKLKKSADPRVLAAVAEARDVRPQRRTLKINRKAAQ